jgi:hypothetical protein
MPILFKNIEAEVIEQIQTTCEHKNSLTSVIVYGDWFELTNVEGFLQDFRKINDSKTLDKMNYYGLKLNKKLVQIEVSY